MKYQCPLCGCITSDSDTCETCGSLITGKARPVKTEVKKAKSEVKKFRSPARVMPTAGPAGSRKATSAARAAPGKKPTPTSAATPGAPFTVSVAPAAKPPPGPAKRWLTLVISTALFVGCFVVGARLGNNSAPVSTSSAPQAHERRQPTRTAAANPPAKRQQRNNINQPANRQPPANNRQAIKTVSTPPKNQRQRNRINQPVKTKSKTPAIIARITVSRCNFRKQPLITPGNIIGTLPHNSIALLLDQRSVRGTYWYFVTFKGQKGWLSSQVCEVRAAKKLHLYARAASNFFLRQEPDYYSPGKLVSTETSFWITSITESGWANMRNSSGQSGYARLAWLNTATKSPKPAQRRSTARYARANDDFYLRRQPGFASGLVTFRIYKGERLRVIQVVKSGWAKVKTQRGVSGYAPLNWLDTAVQRRNTTTPRRKIPAFGRAKKQFYLRREPYYRSRKSKYMTYKGEHLQIMNKRARSGWDNSGQVGYLPLELLE